MNDSYVSVVTAELITCGTLLGPLPLNSGAPDSLAVLTWRCIDKLPTAKQILKVSSFVIRRVDIPFSILYSMFTNTSY